MILTVSQMQELERVAFQHGVDPARLMEEAGERIAHAIEQFFPDPKIAVAYCGKGHNAGDALVAARFLAQNGWKILVRLAFPKNEMALLSRAHLQELEEYDRVTILDEMPRKLEKSNTLQGPLVLLDGLLGIGARGAPSELLQKAIEEIDFLRRTRSVFVVGIDLPSGLDGTTGIPSPYCVQADLTLTIAFAKTGLIADTATEKVGRLAVLPLSELPVSLLAEYSHKNEVPEDSLVQQSLYENTRVLSTEITQCALEVASPKNFIAHTQSSSVILSSLLRKLLPPRPFNVHKGIFGHVGILAGSPGFLGAARLASTAALHAGAGLVTLYALPEIYELLAVSISPEVMVKPIQSYVDLLKEPITALGIGPGLGDKHHYEILEIIEKMPVPCVVDADALNALAKEHSLLLTCQHPRLLTPHPGEMERLFPCKERSRVHWAQDFVEQYHVTLLLKGARTLIAEYAESVLYNTTGNPGMSSGGMGDVLTGVTTALLAAGHSCRNAAQLGAWLCGRSAEIAIYHSGMASESLVASSVIDHLGMAFHSMRMGEY